MKMKEFLGNHYIQNNNSNYKIPYIVKNNSNFKMLKDLENKYYENIYLKSQGNEYSEDLSDNMPKIITEKNKSFKFENISTKTVKGYNKRSKEIHNIKKHEEKYPEEFHFFKISKIQRKSGIKKGFILSEVSHCLASLGLYLRSQ